MLRLLFILICLIVCFDAYSTHIPWRKLDQSIVQEAKRDNKIILLNLEANWCHWCHVMHDSTYGNPDVINYINEHFIPVKADQDANPELSNRYKDYGWPATIFINGKGEDVVKRAGYISPKSFLRLLQAIVADPSPEEENRNLLEAGSSSADRSKLTSKLERNYTESLDFERGGFDQSQKFVEWATYEYAIFGSKNENITRWINVSVIGAKQLSDPYWGGIYQYSTHNDWEHLHFEKLLSIQARYINIFLLHYYYLGDKTSLDYAKSTADYANRFLMQPSGLFGNSQDADLIQGEHAEAYFNLNNFERLKLGIPKVDTNTFTDNNAGLASAYTKLYYATGDENYRQLANTIYNALLKRKDKNGLFQHAYKPSEIFSLRDQIAMVDLMIERLKTNYADNETNMALQELLVSIEQLFKAKNGSFVSFSGDNGLPPQPLIEENIRIARNLNWFAAFSKEAKWKELAQNCYTFLSSEEVATRYYSQPSLLLLQKELEVEPTQYVYLNRGKGESFENTIRSMIPFYSILISGKLESLPQEKQDLIASFEENVLLMCTSSTCSSPLFTAESLRKKLQSRN